MLPTLYKLSSTGKLLQWYTDVRDNADNGDHWDIITIFGQEGGKMRTFGRVSD